MTNASPPQFTDIRPVRMPDGTLRDVRMTPDHWAWKEGMELLEGVSEQQMAEWALEEQGLNEDLDFDMAFRGIVITLANRWEV